jgi:hypothetical protein
VITAAGLVDGGRAGLRLTTAGQAEHPMALGYVVLVHSQWEVYVEHLGDPS